jgi:hypothetical protein
MLFLMAAVAKDNFEDPAEQLRAVTAAFLALAGRTRPTRFQRERIALELAKQ